MFRIDTDYILSTVRKSGADNEVVRKAIDALLEAVWVSGKKDTFKVKKAQAAYIKALDDAVKQLSNSR